MSIDAKGHQRRHRKSRKRKNIKTGGVPLHQSEFGFAAKIAVLGSPRWRQQTAEEKARDRKHAEQERDEQIAAVMRDHPALLPCLEFAVPKWIERLRHRPYAAIEARAGELVDIVACESDALERDGKPGQAARVFNALAEGLAALSFGPGGVTWLGMHFECVHPESPRASGQQEASP